jgi:hypothetical protein
VVFNKGYMYPRGDSGTSHGYAKLGGGERERERENKINTEYSEPDLGLATGEPDVRTFN